MHLLHYKRWVYAALALAALLYIGITVAFLSLKAVYMTREYVMWEQVAQATRGKNLPATTDLAYLGDSRAKAALLVKQFEEQTGLHTLNLTLGGATPVEGYYVLNNALQHSTPKAVLISYAPHHLTIVDTYWDRAVKFHLLGVQQYREIARQAQVHQDERLTADTYLNYFLKPGLYLTDAYHGLSERRWRDNRQVAAELEASGGHYFFGREPGFSGLNEEVHDRHFRPSPLIGYYLQEMIKLAQSKGVRLYWYSMPFNSSSMAALEPQYLADYHAYLQGLAGPNFVVLNQLYAEDDAMFGDWSHLYQGAAKATTDIATALCAQLDGACRQF